MQRVIELYDGRKSYLSRSKENGAKPVGYLCSFVPAELITAAGLLPVRITGDPMVEVGKADEYIEPIVCSYVRNVFERLITDEYSMLDGIVFAASCDAVERAYGLLHFHHKAEFLHFLHVPHTITASSEQFFRQELELFIRNMERSFHVVVTDTSIREAIKLHNENKDLVRKLYRLRVDLPAHISGAEMTALMVVGMTISALDYNILLKDLYTSLLSTGQQDKTVKKPRVLLAGCIVDNKAVVERIEDSGAAVVIDDTCIGTKTYFNTVPVQDNDPLAALTSAYFTNLLCPRTYRRPGKTEFNYLLKLIDDYRADGVIVYYIKFCDNVGFDFPEIRDVLREKKIPVLFLEDDYRMANVEAQKTRIQAFCENMKTDQG